MAGPKAGIGWLAACGLCACLCAIRLRAGYFARARSPVAPCFPRALRAIVEPRRVRALFMPTRTAAQSASVASPIARAPLAQSTKRASPPSTPCARPSLCSRADQQLRGGAARAPRPPPSHARRTIDGRRLPNRWPQLSSSRAADQRRYEAERTAPSFAPMPKAPTSLRGSRGALADPPLHIRTNPATFSRGPSGS